MAVPFYGEFRKRKAIKIATAGIPSSTLASFPKLFTITADMNIGDELTAQRLAVTLADGITLVPFGVLSFTSASGSATITFRAKFDLANTLSNGDTIGYLYYDNSGTDRSNKSGVLDSNTSAYFPLEEDPSGSAPQISDWSSNAAHGTTNGSMSSGQSITGQVSKGLTLDATDDYVAFPTGAINTALNGSAWTISFLIKPGASSAPFICVGPKNGGNQRLIGGHWVAGLNITLVEENIAVIGPIIPITASTWQHIAYTYGSGTVRAWKNGVEQGSGASYTFSGNATGAYSLSGGEFGTAADYDELKFDATNRSSNWLLYDYTDQFSNNTTFTLGSQEAIEVANNSLKYWFNGLPVQGADRVSGNDIKYWFNGLPAQDVLPQVVGFKSLLAFWMGGAVAYAPIGGGGAAVVLLGSIDALGTLGSILNRNISNGSTNMGQSSLDGRLSLARSIYGLIDGQGNLNGYILSATGIRSSLDGQSTLGALPIVGMSGSGLH